MESTNNRFRCEQFNDGATLNHITLENLTTGVFYHFALTSDGANIYLYINGALVGQTVQNAKNGVGDFRLGTNSTITAGFDGFLDEIAFYSTNFSSVDVQNIYHRQALRFTELSPMWTPLWNNIVGYWKMDGNWQDSSGKENHGTPFLGTDFDGNSKVGLQAGVFDGVDDYIEVSDSTDFDSFDQMTVMAWANPDNTCGNDAIAVKGLVTYEWLLYCSGGSAALYSAYIRLTTGVYITPPNTIDRQNQWTHLALVFDRSLNEKRLKLYINGVLATSHDAADAAILANGSDIYIGSQFNALTTGFSGLIDDVSLWSVALSSSDVSEVYHRQKQKFAGSYQSEIVDLGSATSTWPDLAWSTSLPFEKELVGDFGGDGSLGNESSIDYPGLQLNLNYGLLAYWPMNESVVTAGANNDFLDVSSNSKHLESNTSSVFRQQGRLGRAIFCGNSDLLTVSSLAVGNNWSISTWFKAPFPDPTNSYNTLIFGSNDYHVLVQESSGMLGTYEFSGPATLFNSSGFDTRTLGNGWHHLVAIGENNTTKFYIDSKYVGESLFQATEDIKRVGNRPALNQPWGWIDELALWERNLSLEEIQQLYRRGANRIKFQVKSCIDASCNCKSFNLSPLGSSTDCDGDATANALDFNDVYKAEFIGPGGDGTTYYSELFNRRSTDLTFNCGINTTDGDSNVCVNDEITLGAGARPNSPLIDYSDFPLIARPTANPYFQYKVYMEADDNTACAGNTCLPELTSVNLNPSGQDKYYGGIQEVQPAKPLVYTSLQSIEIDADDCATYQLSPDGINYFYVIGGAWVPATEVSHRSTKIELENNIVKYSDQFAPGLLYIKVFLTTNSPQTSSCGVRDIDIVSKN